MRSINPIMMLKSVISVRLVSLLMLSILSVGLLASCTASQTSVQVQPAVAQAAVAELPAEISVEKAATYYSAGAFVLDVRQPEEWNEVHIPNTTLIPLPELSSRLSELPKDESIIIICRSGNRSAQARDILLRAGFEATSVAGGMNDWKAAGYPTTTGP